MVKLLTVTEVAELTRLKKCTIYKMISEKRIPHIKINNSRVLFDENEIISWIQARRVAPVNM